MMPCPERVWLVIDTIDAGVWCCQRRLHRGHFTWTSSTERSVSLTGSFIARFDVGVGRWISCQLRGYQSNHEMKNPEFTS